jgi:hypothetical protein
MFYVENYVGCTLAIGNVKQACTSRYVCNDVLMSHNAGKLSYQDVFVQTSTGTNTGMLRGSIQHGPK